MSSFGFSDLQTTLLGIVSGFVEVATIFTGVHGAARRAAAERARVGGHRVLPADDARHRAREPPPVVGQGRAALWPVDHWCVVRAHLAGPGGSDAARTAGISITGFVLSLSWLSNVTAGHTKRVTTNAIMLVAYCVENAAGPFMWQAQYLPRCAVPRFSGRLV